MFDPLLTPLRRPFTVWELRSPSTGETRIVAYATEPCEPEHEYQRVVGRTSTYTKEEAVATFSHL